MPASGSDYELLTEHFGYPPVALIDDIINAVNILADRALDSVESLLLSLPPTKLGLDAAAARPTIEHATHQLETLLNASIDHNFDLFELYTMRNILAVTPADQPWVRLAHYHGLDFSHATPSSSAADSSSARDSSSDPPASLVRLRRQLHATQCLGLALKAEHHRNSALLTKLTTLVGDAPTPSSSAPLAFIHDKAALTSSGGALHPLATTAEFAASQTPALRSLSHSLRALVPALDNADTASPHTASASPHSKRARYIESSTRTYLERARGLELGPQGDVRDGEWQGPGRAVGKDEVEGLESVAAALRHDSEPSASGHDAETEDKMDTTEQ